MQLSEGRRRVLLRARAGRPRDCRRDAGATVGGRFRARSFSSAHGWSVAGVQRKEHVQARAFAQRENAVGDFVDRVFLDFLAAVQAVGAADAGEEQAQVVVDLGGGGDGRARVARGVLLLDGDGRSNAVDQIDVGLLDALQKLARVGRERLDIAALAFGVDRVEGERRLAGTGHAGDDRQ